MISSDTNRDAFQALLSHRLITDAQHDAVLAHPEYAALPVLPGPTHALAWMRLKALITEEEVDAVIDELEDEDTSEPSADFSEAEDIAYDAEDMLDIGATGVTHEAVDALFKEGLIDTATRDMALQSAPVVGAPAALGTALGWMVTEGLLDQEVFDATRARVAAEPPFATAADHRRIVDEAQAAITADAQMFSEWQREFARQNQTTTWKFRLILLAILAVIGWSIFGR